MAATINFGVRSAAANTALVVDVLELAHSNGRRGCVVAVEDSFTYTLALLAELCITAKRFDFDIKILQAGLVLAQSHFTKNNKPLASPPSTKRTDITCRKVRSGFWLRFDSRGLFEAIVAYFQTQDPVLDLAYQYLFALLDSKQDWKDTYAPGQRKPRCCVAVDYTFRQSHQERYVPTLASFRVSPVSPERSLFDPDERLS